MTKSSRPRYVTHDTHPDCPPGEVWLDSKLTAAERAEVVAELGIKNSVVYHSTAAVEREPSEEAQRHGAIVKLLGEIAQPPEEPRRTIVNVAAPSVSYQCPDFPVRELAEALAESLADRQNSAIKSMLTAFKDAMKDLVDALAHAQPIITVSVPPSNPTPVSLTLPAEEKKKPRKKKFTKNAEGEIDGVEEVD